MPDRTTTSTSIDQYLGETHDARLESYKDFLRIPSISALPEHAADCRAAGARALDLKPIII